jgi:hypothetical protein
MHDYSFDARKKIWNENVQRKFCQESSNLPFAVPGNVKLKLPNNEPATQAYQAFEIDNEHGDYIYKATDWERFNYLKHTSKT